jgi:hypothetical protein
MYNSFLLKFDYYLIVLKKFLGFILEKSSNDDSDSLGDILSSLKRK